MGSCEVCPEAADLSEPHEGRELKQRTAGGSVAGRHECRAGRPFGMAGDWRASDQSCLGFPFNPQQKTVQLTHATRERVSYLAAMSKRAKGDGDEDCLSFV